MSSHLRLKINTFYVFLSLFFSSFLLSGCASQAQIELMEDAPFFLSTEEIAEVFEGATVHLKIDNKIHPLYLSDKKTLHDLVLRKKYREAILFLDKDELRGGPWHHAWVKPYNKEMDGICISHNTATVGMLTGSTGWRGKAKACFIVKKKYSQYQFICTNTSGLCWNTPPNYTFDIVKVEPGDTMELESYLSKRSSKTLGLVRQAQSILLSPLVDTLTNQEAACEMSSSTNTLYITAETGGWMFSNTIRDFKVKIEGKDCASGFHKSEEREAGDRFLQDSYATFYAVPAGQYEISIRGYNQSEEEVFTMQTTYDFPGDGAYYCTVTLDDKMMRCERQY